MLTVLHTFCRFQEGDIVIIGDGTVTGLVQKMGWLNTHVRLGNDNIVRVPNTQIAGYVKDYVRCCDMLSVPLAR